MPGVLFCALGVPIVSKEKRLRRSRNAYALGAKVAVDSIIREAIEQPLSPDKAMQYAACLANTMETMVKDNDTEAPFLTRAAAMALDKTGIETYESAFERIREQTKPHRNPAKSLR